MKLTIATKALRSALERLNHLPGGNTADVSANLVQITVDGFSGVTLKRASVTTMAWVSVEAEMIDEDGEAVVGYAHLLGIVGRLGSANLNLLMEGTNLVVENGHGRAKIATDQSSMHPDPDTDGGGKETLFLHGDEFRSLVRAVEPAVSTDRPELQGIVVRPVGDRMAFMATDGRMVHVAYISEQMPLQIDATIPTSAIESLKKLITDDRQNDFIFRDSTLEVVGESFSMITALLEGKAPNFNHIVIVPEERIEAGVEVARLDLLESVKACMSVNPDRLLISVQLDEIILHAENSIVDINREVACASSKPMVIKVNPTYFCRSLEACTGDKIVIEVIPPNMIQVEQDDRKIMLAQMK